MLIQMQTFTQSITGVGNVNWANAGPGGENGRPVFRFAGRTLPCGCFTSATPDSSMNDLIASTPDISSGGAP
jgi:hypothetical protein